MAGSPLPPVSAATRSVLTRLGEEMASAGDPQIAAHTRIGQVTALDSATITATVAYGAGANLVAIAGHHWLDGHQPAVNDYVMVLSQDGDNWIVGKVATFYDRPPSVRVQRNVVGASIGDATDTALPWHETAYNYGGMWTSGTDVNIPLAGIYDIKAGGGFANHANGRRIMTLYKNTTALARIEPAAPTTGGFSPTFDWVGQVSTEIDCAAGDAIQCKVYQSSGGGLALSSFIYPWMTVTWVRPL